MEAGQLHQRVRCRYPHRIAAAGFVNQRLDVGIRRLALLGIHHLNVVELALLPGISLLFVAIKYNDCPAFGEACVAAHNIAQLPPGGVQIGSGLLRQLLPSEYDVVAVHNQVFILGRPDGDFLGCRTVLRLDPVLGAADGAELPLHDGFQLFVLNMQVPGQQLGRLFLFQSALQVHIVHHPIPFHVEARPMGTEYGIRGIVQIRFRVVGAFRDHRFRVVAGGVAVEGQLQTAQPLGVGRQRFGVVLHLGCGHQPPECGQTAAGFRSLKLAAHGPDIGDAPAGLLGGHRENKVVPGFQQHGFGLHQPLPHRPVGGLPEVAALGVLQMGLAHQQGDFHIRNGRAGKDAPVDFFTQVSQNQLLVIAVQHIRGAHGVEHQPAAPGQGLQQQMHLGVVAQGFKMSHALHGIFNGFLVENSPVVQLHVKAKTLLHQRLKDFQLHPAHDLHMDLAVFPQEPELGFFLLQKPQLGQHHRRIRPRRESYPVSHHRLQSGRLSLRLRAKGLSRPCLGQARHRHQFSRFHSLRGSKFIAGIGSQLQNLFLDIFTLGIFVGKGRANLQFAAGELEPCQAVSLSIPGNFVDLRPKFRGILPFRSEFIQNFQQLVHAVQLQRGAKAAGKQLPFLDQPPQIPFCDHTGFQIGFQQGLVAQGGIFRDCIKVLPKIHASGGKLPVQGFQKFLFFHCGKIHLVDEQERGHMVSLQQPPQGQGMGLHPIGAADDQHGAVQNRHSPLGLRGEVHVPRGIHQRDFPVGRFQQGLLGKNGNAPGTLQRMGVEECVLMVHPPQHPLGTRRI